MTEAIVAAVQGFPPEAATALLAALPVTELRAAIPAAVGVFHLGPWSALLWAVLGNLLPVPFVLWFLPPVVKLAELRIPVLHRALDRYFRSLEAKHRASYDKWGALALAIFVAIPLPLTGAWTASVLAVLFSIKFRTALPAIAAGVLTAGGIVLALTVGVSRLF